MECGDANITIYIQIPNEHRFLAQESALSVVRWEIRNEDYVLFFRTRRALENRVELIAH